MSDNIYCTYFTFYSGNKLPPFYIGSSSVDKVNKGYHGSVVSRKYQSIWKQELHDHPSLFKTQITSEHLTRPEALLKERKFHVALGVQNSSMYINQSIAMTTYYSTLGSKHSAETKKKLSEAWKGRKHSAEAKKNMSEAKKGKKHYAVPQV